MTTGVATNAATKSLGCRIARRPAGKAQRRSASIDMNDLPS
jgi:hypothetical protein